jgi:DNA modification methylase
MDARAASDGADADAIPEPPKVPVTQRGDLWILGDHRLLCGDSTSEEDVRRVMGGARAVLMNTDPPYGVSYANDDRPNPGVAKPRVAKDDLSDAALQAFLESAFRPAKSIALVDNAAWYLWHAHLTQGFFAAAAAAAANVVLHRQIIWVKPVLLLGRGQYHWKHEPCFMGWVDGHQPPDYGLGNGERTQTTVWEIQSVTQAERAEFNHATPKPVALFEIPIVKHSRGGESVYEPFAGSGPQVIAAEKHGRRCHAVELEPMHCDVIVERWQKFSGKAAVRADS